MREDFELSEDADGRLEVKLPEHGLNGEADDLFELVSAEIDSRRWNSISLDASDAAITTLEGIGVLVRLRMIGEHAGIPLRVHSPHPALEQRLLRTGILALMLDSGS
jgi:hypothetical protein